MQQEDLILQTTKSKDHYQLKKTKKSCFNGQQDGWKNNERICMIKTKKCTLINITNT